MSATVTAAMRRCRNFFEYGYRDKTIRITDGKLEPDSTLAAGMWIGIQGARNFDGVWKLGQGLQLLEAPHSPDEEFDGRIWYLAPPADFVDLCEKIETFREKAPVTGYTSESFGEYSYTRASGQAGAVTWQEAFSADLVPFRRMFTEVGI